MTKMSRRFLAVSIAAAAAIAGSTCALAGDDTIEVATSFPLTGSCAADGQNILNAVQLATDQTNAAGGIDGKTIELVSNDDEADPSAAATIANKMASDDKIVAMINSYNASCSLAQIPICEPAQLSMISPVSTSPQFTGMSDYFFRTSSSDAMSGEEAAKACQKIGMTNVYVLYENDDYGQGIYDVYKATLEDIGLKEAGVDTFVYGETKDFSSIITKIKNSGADGVMFIGLVTEAGEFAQQAGDLGMPVFMGDGCYTPDMLTVGGSSIEGYYSCGSWDPTSDDEQVKTFIKDYEDAYDGADPTNWAANGYDAAMALFEALKSCDTIDRASVNEALHNVDYDGVTGEIKFVDGDVTKTYNFYQVKDGAWAKIDL